MRGGGEPDGPQGREDRGLRPSAGRELKPRLIRKGRLANPRQGIELTLLDCVRYPHRAAGQIVKDLGAKADPRQLAKLAHAYENSAVRRLGYLLELARHARQAKALEPFALAAKSAKPLDPSIRSLAASPARAAQKSARWKLLIHAPVELDA